MGERVGAGLRRLAILLAGIGAGAVCIAADEKPAREPAPVAAIPVYKTAPITVDGVLDEPAWQTAKRLPIHYIMGQKNKVAPDAKSDFMLAWDARYLYVAYRNPSPIRPKSAKTDRMVGPPGNRIPQMLCQTPANAFELNVDLCAGGTNVWELHHTAQNYWLAKLCIRPRDKDDPLWNLIGNRGCPVFFITEIELKDDGQHQLKTAVREILERKDGQEVFAGYTTEWAVPLSGLGAPMERRKGRAYQLEGHRFRAFGGEWAIARDPKTGKEDGAWYHSVPDSTKMWFVDVLLEGHVWEFRGIENRESEK